MRKLVNLSGTLNWEIRSNPFRRGEVCASKNVCVPFGHVSSALQFSVARDDTSWPLRRTRYIMDAGCNSRSTNTIGRSGGLVVTLECCARYGVGPGVPTHRGEIWDSFAKIKKGQLLRAPSVGRRTIRRVSTREQFDACQRGKKEMKNYRDKNARHEP